MVRELSIRMQTTLNATYTPSQGEINAGTLTFTLTSTGNGTCTAVTDDVTYTFGPSPTANAGTDKHFVQTMPKLSSTAQ